MRRLSRLAARRAHGQRSRCGHGRSPPLGEPADVMSLAEVPAPGAVPGHVLVECWRAALNFPDVLMARGHYQVRPPLPFMPGRRGLRPRWSRSEPAWPAAGSVTGSSACRPLPHGGLAEQALMPAEALFAAPAVAGRRRGGRADDRLPDGVRRARPSGRACSRARPCWCTPPPAGWARPPSRSARRSGPGSSASWAAPPRPRSPRRPARTWSSTARTEDLVAALKEVPAAAVPTWCSTRWVAPPTTPSTKVHRLRGPDRRRRLHQRDDPQRRRSATPW